MAVLGKKTSDLIRAPGYYPCVDVQTGSIVLFSVERHPEMAASRVKLAKYTKFREEKFGAVLFETRSEKVFTLNATAAAVVREIGAGAANLEEILRKLHARYSNGDGRIERDAGAFIMELRAKGLLED